MKYAFIQSDLSMYDVSSCREVLDVSVSGYYQSLGRGRSARALRREELAVKIQVAHGENRGVYGSPRIHRVLLAQGEKVCENTVAKVMKAHEIRAKIKRQFVPRTTDSAHHQPVAGKPAGAL